MEATADMIELNDVVPWWRADQHLRFYATCKWKAFKAWCREAAKVTALFFGCLTFWVVLAKATVIAFPVAEAYWRNEGYEWLREKAAHAGEWAGLRRPPLTVAQVKHLIVARAPHYKVKPAFALANSVVESALNELEVSHVGAIGVMQIMPFNAERCGLKPRDLLDPVKNVDCGLQILSADLAAVKGEEKLAAARYNGGPKAVEVIARCGWTDKKCLGWKSDKRRGYFESAEHGRKVMAEKARIEKNFQT